MSGDKLWALTVVAALSSLLILAYFTLYPMISKESTAQRMETGLASAIDKFDSIKNEQNDESTFVPKPST